MYDKEYEHTGVDRKGRTHIFWSLSEDASKGENCSFDGTRWLEECVPTGKSRKYQEPPFAFVGSTSFAFYH
jgi:hypothetical protein